MKREIKYVIHVLIIVMFTACTSSPTDLAIQDVEGLPPASNQIWLSHEHILVDFIGADSIDASDWNHDSVINEMLPYFEELKKFNVNYFVECTPKYLGRDVKLLEKLAKKTGIRIITNTGLYGARNNLFIPAYAHEMSAEELAEIWIDEYVNGIDNTSIRPGFIKIAVDKTEPLHEMHQKLVKAAALTHLETGLTIASHTGKAIGLWPQLEILVEMGVSPEAFIWVHAQSEKDHEAYIKAAEMGCWISFDGITKDVDKYVERIQFAKDNNFLNRVLLSHDAGWYDPQKEVQTVKPYTNIFTGLYPALIAQGFTEEEFNLLVSVNPSKAFSIGIRTLD